MTIRVGLVGLGFMGNGHLQNYIQLTEEGEDVSLVAICDVDPKKQKGALVEGNLPVGVLDVDFSQYHFYSEMTDMIVEEALDYVDICTPTYLHSQLSIQAMELGVNVFCEKPMALNSTDCQKMIDTAKRTNKYLMIGQCLRFFPPYQYVKSAIDDHRYGKVVNATFFRGGTTPRWSWNNWMLHKEYSGGCLLDQHIHDVDAVNWLFGMPQEVSTVGKNIIPGSGYDVVSTHYLYDEQMVVQAADNWTINSDDYGFEMRFRIDFEHGSIGYENGKLVDYPYGQPAFSPDIDERTGYYFEIKHYIHSLQNNIDPAKALPLQSTKATIVLAETELASADQSGERQSVLH